jgi:hypothetical protein
MTEVDIGFVMVTQNRISDLRGIGDSDTFRLLLYSNMGDVRDILGAPSSSAASAVPPAPSAGDAKAGKRARARKPPGISREVFALLDKRTQAEGEGAAGPVSLPSMVAGKPTTGLKSRRDATASTKW